MKIQLQHNLNFPVDRFHCLVCQQKYTGDVHSDRLSQQLRTLLCHNDGSIAGDVCAKCIKQGSSYIQQRLKTRSIELCQQSSIDDIGISTYRQALELSELAVESLIIPPFYTWWWQKIMLFAAETRALEMARREGIDCRYRQSKSHKITFLTKNPSIGKDN
jgi:hypothetical protein